jgi:glycosyltransferase involved in cell wall biosynthesis
MQDKELGTKKMKIAFLSAKMCLGGAERVISNLVNALSNHAEIHMLLLYEQTEKDYTLNGEVVSLWDKKKRNRIKEIPYYCSKIKSYVEKNDINVVVSFMEYPNLLILLTPVKVRKIISVRNFMTEKWKGMKGLPWKLSFRLLYPKADIVICPTQLIVNDMVDNYKVPLNKTKIIHNPFEIEKISENMLEAIEDKYASWFKGNTIITMGSLSHAKGHRHLLKSFALAKKVIDNVKLVILGEGECESSLRKLAKDYSIDDDILFLGFQSNPYRYIKHAEIYVLSSYYEGFPNALVEAMVCGIPVISTDCKSGPREIIAPNTDISFSTDCIEYSEYGVLVPTFKNQRIVDNIMYIEEQALSEAIICLIQGKELYQKYKEKSCERALDFHINNVLKMWLKLFFSDFNDATTKIKKS